MGLYTCTANTNGITFIHVPSSQTCHHYNIKIIVVQCLSVMEGHWKRFVYLAMEHTKLELGHLCEQHSWQWLQVKALASWTECTKNGDNGHIYSGLVA